jgi:hypothetical protein
MRLIFKSTFLFLFLRAGNCYSQNCSPYQPPCQAYIDQSRLPSISPQQTLLWCWAASAQSIFRYYGFEIDQVTIVRQTLGKVVYTSASAQMMIMMLNTQYTDKYGKKFKVRTPKIYDGFSWLSANPYLMQNLRATVLTNNDIVTALSNGRPLMLGTSTHAVMLTAMGYYLINGVVSPVNGWVLDPFPSTYNPNIAIGLRQLAPNEMIAFFMADVMVYKGW